MGWGLGGQKERQCWSQEARVVAVFSKQLKDFSDHLSKRNSIRNVLTGFYTLTILHTGIMPLLLN